MAKKTKKQAKKTGSGWLSVIAGEDWGGGWFRIVGWVGGGLAIIGAWILGVPRLEVYAAAAGNGEIEVRFIHAPGWVTEELQGHLEAIARGELSGGLLAQEDLERVGLALREDGWIEQVRQVRRVGEQAISIEADFASPFAVVRDGEGDHLVDGKGKLLPLTIPAGSKHQLIAITNTHFPRPMRAGLLWEGMDVTAGLLVLEQIRDKPWLKQGQVVAIDLTGFMETGMVTLVSDRGCRIIWGSAPGKETALESLAKRKLDYLKYQYEQFGHIDLGHTGEIDLTGKDHVVKR